MADFVQTMKDWRRMCDTIQSENQRKSTGGWCKGCPLQGLCVIDTSIKDSTDREFDVTGNLIQSWAAEHPEPVYPTWVEYLVGIGVIPHEIRLETVDALMDTHLLKPIPADIAQKLGIEPMYEPKEVQHE